MGKGEGSGEGWGEGEGLGAGFGRGEAEWKHGTFGCLGDCGNCKQNCQSSLVHNKDEAFYVFKRFK